LKVDFAAVEPIARAVLYEGYRLYPYHAASLKNGRPCAFGSLFPRAYSMANGAIEPWSMQTECLVHTEGRATLHGTVRFLHTGGPDERETAERAVALPPCDLHKLAAQSVRVGFAFPDVASATITGCVVLSAAPAHVAAFKLCLRINNESAADAPDDLAGHTMLSTHSVLGVTGGRFLSLIDPPDDIRHVAEGCRNRGAWPVLIGDRERQDMVLAAPIILYDFPQIAPESPGNLFDGTEIDELLTLRILTLTAAEKHAMTQDPRTRTILERAERLPQDWMLALHGTMRSEPTLRPGARVRLCPRGRADIFDVALAGMLATIAGIEHDLEGGVYYTVTLDGDPGQDLGIAGKPGHRFFFRREELELA
jgi:hypothetical protein